MIKIAILEDEKDMANTIISYINRYAEANHIETTSVHFENPVTFLESYTPFDIVFMDIEMPLLDGYSCAKRLRIIDKEVPVIFVTNLAQYAIKGYEVGAFDFIVKPITYNGFVLKLRRIFERININCSPEIWVQTRQFKKSIYAAKLMYVEVMKHNLIFHTTEGDIRGTGTLKSIKEKLMKAPFAFCNQCYLVNLRYVSAIDGDVVYVNNTPLQISTPKRKAFLQALNEYLGAGGRLSND